MHDVVLKFNDDISSLVNCGPEESPQENRTGLSVGHLENTTLPLSF